MAIFQNKKIILVLVIAGILISFGSGFFIGKKQVICKVCKPEEIDFSLFWEAYDKIQKEFVDPQRLGVPKMIYGAISGMVKALGDPYTIFLSPDDTKKFLEDVSGRFEGVGMEIGEKKGQLQVIAPLEGTPAQRAGLRPGDKILKINDTLTADLSVDEAVSLIRGPKGTEVTLTILRDEWETPKEMKLVRDVIEIPSLKWELKDGSEKQEIAYIKIYQFSEKASFDLAQAAWEIINSPAKKIILDLRNNPGGYLEVAQDIAGWFLERGQVVVVEDFGGKKEQKIYKAEGNAAFLEYPVVILINQGSASASEILTGALRDNRQVKIIGEKSFGKGSVQELDELTDGSTLKITIANWLTPKGQLITDKGLEPDITISITDEDFEEDRDPQLDKAIEVIKEMR